MVVLTYRPPTPSGRPERPRSNPHFLLLLYIMPCYHAREEGATETADRTSMASGSPFLSVACSHANAPDGTSDASERGPRAASAAGSAKVGLLVLLSSTSRIVRHLAQYNKFDVTDKCELASEQLSKCDATSAGDPWRRDSPSGCGGDTGVRGVSCGGFLSEIGATLLLGRPSCAPVTPLPPPP